MEFLERETQLACLAASFERTARREGACVLIYGEAGIGKTTLMRQFVAVLKSDANILIAGCEALFTPRPLGPLVDLADQLPPSLAAALHEGRIYNGLFPSFLAFLRDARKPVILVIEDVHWADAGTLDFIRYVGRRLTGLPVLLLLTYRDDELTPAHPLRRVLGELPAASTTRLPLTGLSNQAVHMLACAAHRPAQGLFEVTGGNPFFVTEVLMNAQDGVPASVRDAVLARIAHLSHTAREAAEVASIAPKRIERSMLDALVFDANAEVAIDECTTLGVLTQQGAWLAFRHELARQAVEQSLAPERRARLHRKAFEHLSGQSAELRDLARLVHHAEHGGLTDTVLAFAPQAAERSARVSAHREAAALYAVALKYSEFLGLSERAGLFEAAAHEYLLIGAIDKSLAATRDALALRRVIGDHLHEGMNLRLLAVTQWREYGERGVCEQSIAQAIASLERLPQCAELARAYAARSMLQNHWSEYKAALASGETALALAESVRQPQALVEALQVSASARMCLGDDRQARAQMERALAIAIDERLEDAAGQLFIALTTVAFNYRDHVFALDVGSRGVAYCEARDLDMHLLRLFDRRATCLVEMGRWDEADRDLETCLAAPAISTRLRNTAVFLRERLGLRRGAQDAQAYWCKVQESPESLRVEYRLPAIAAACAEAAWLRNDLPAAARIAQLGLNDALKRADARLAGPLLVWLKRIGVPVADCALAIAPAHARELAGDLAGAASEWARLCCPYERALALAQGDEAQLREALQVFHSLGAAPAAEIARRRLRALGARSVGRGPQPRTRIDPLGLTARQREVFALLLQGLSNAAIAASLHRSERTVEHHVADLLAKLNASSRAELIARTAKAVATQRDK